MSAPYTEGMAAPSTPTRSFIPWRRRHEDCLVTLKHWEPWKPKLRVERWGPLWTAIWKGPMGGRHEVVAFTRKGLDRSVERTLAGWTRKKRRVVTKRRTQRRAPLKTCA